MVKRLLVIDRDDKGHFFLSVEAGVMTIGGDAKNTDAVLRDLQISRIHCEVEVDGDLVTICNPESASGQKAGGVPLRRELYPGQALHIGHSHLHLEGGAPSTSRGAAEAESSVLPEFTEEILVEEVKKPAAVAPAPTQQPAAVSQGRLLKKLIVIDGADKGRSFSLPDEGSVTIGQSKKSADLILHDLYVSRVHCELSVEQDHVFVTHLHGENGTLVNGQKISEQELKIGDVLRIGNSHLRFEIVPFVDKASNDGEEDEYELEVVEEENDTAATESVDAATAENADPYSLPHAPVDQLLKLEGQSLGHFKIGPLLGRGQSSLVFRALDTKNQQLVALKVISPDFPADNAEMQRFARALKVLAPLQNPHLLTLHGAGMTGPYCWIAREYVEGDSLGRLIQRLSAGGRIDWTRACRVATHLGKALEFLHRHRVSHGNITPRNVLIRKSDRVTKLADLMLSRALEGSRLQKAILGKKLLTELPYLAPEQTDPHAPGTTLGDLYSLGAVTYSLLTGQPPFAGSTPRELLARIREGKVVKPSQLQRGIPAPFEAAVLMMMARRPEDRVQTAAEMLAAIKHIAEENEIEV
jgi:serine/threonine-protein kinase